MNRVFMITSYMVIHWILKVKAKDLDESSHIRYSLADVTNGGRSLFRIDQTTGVLTLLQRPDEETAEFVLTVQVIFAQLTLAMD